MEGLRWAIEDRFEAAKPSAIRSALEGFADRLNRIGVEASSLRMWLYRELHATGLPVIVVEARHMRVSLSAMRNKPIATMPAELPR